MRPISGMALATFLIFAGCDGPIRGEGLPAKGSGVPKQESRGVPNFHEVEVASTFEADITIGPEPKVTLDLDDNLLPLVKTDVKDGRLVVRFEQGYNIQASRPLKVTIVAPSLDFIGAGGASKLGATGVEAKTFVVNASGASSIQVDGLVADAIDVDASGSTRVTLKGRASRLTLDVSGASKVVAGEIPFESATVDISGASQAEVQVTGSIGGEVSGASSLSVQGKPKSRDVKTSGASSVTY